MLELYGTMVMVMLVVIVSWPVMALVEPEIVALFRWADDRSPITRQDAHMLWSLAAMIGVVAMLLVK